MTPHQQLIAGLESLLEQARKLPDSPPDSAAPKMTRGQMVARTIITIDEDAIEKWIDFDFNPSDCQKSKRVVCENTPTEMDLNMLRDVVAAAIDAEREQICVALETDRFSVAASFIREGRDYREGM